MTEPKLALRLLDTTFSITSEDARWLKLLEILWKPFKVDPPPSGCVPVLIEQTAQGWTMKIAGGTEVMGPDVWNFAASIRLALENHALDEAAGVVALHAAVVTNHSGALVLAGPVATGKTTLALALIERGWAYSSDDVAPINTVGGGIRRFPRPVGIKGAEHWDRFLKMWDPPSWVPRPEHFFQVPGDAFPRSHHQETQPLAVMFPRYHPETEPKLELVTPGKATLRCMSHVHRADASALATVSRLCDRVPVADVTYGLSADGIDLVEKLLPLTEKAG